MNHLDKKYWLIGLLLLLNFALLATWWLSHLPIIDGERPRNFLIKELQMTDKQELTYDSLIQFHRSQREEIWQQTRTLKEQLVNQISNSDTTQSNRITNQIGDLQVKLERMNLVHFRDIRQMCDERQKQKFDLVIHEMLKMMNGGTERPHQGPPQ
jgi:periplasmic protein CpxP/Spy